MKIALYLTGHLRTYEQTWPNWQEYLLNEHDVDVYVATWDTLGRWVSKGTPNKPDPLDPGTVREDEPLDIERAKSILNPKAFHVMDKQLFDQDSAELLHAVCAWRDSLEDQQYWGYMPKAHMAMYCCWYAADRLRRASGVEYDMIVRARGDLLIEGAIPLQYLNIQGSILTHIRNDINDPMWINDIMFASDPDTMTILCDLYQYYGALFDELSSQNAPQWFFSSHKLIPYYLMARGTAWTEVEFPFKRFNHCLVR